MFFILAKTQVYACFIVGDFDFCERIKNDQNVQIDNCQTREMIVLM
jgi:hypothetical protein